MATSPPMQNPQDSSKPHSTSRSRTEAFLTGRARTVRIGPDAVTILFLELRRTVLISPPERNLGGPTLDTAFSHIFFISNAIFEPTDGTPLAASSPGRFDSTSLAGISILGRSGIEATLSHDEELFRLICPITIFCLSRSGAASIELFNPMLLPTQSKPHVLGPPGGTQQEFSTLLVGRDTSENHFEI
ncbi:hypothetical protein K469DRAFT_752248 [Zopfia rhizophila CBS 207.26]|uniref:Uncharacterized protein n=1 Tax=Zopfia rhizophila CBS 207.26 TaxID=1314779 RepID=A0A6A6DRG4_9PEZI|nr:hypothetical protein K469DRAFT_752248 [Zopfia rhizophila CBS 207.26]